MARLLACLTLALHLVAIIHADSVQEWVDAENSASGTIYVVRHADTNGAVAPYGINEKGLRRAAYMVTIFDGSKFLAPASIIAAKVPEDRQRMIDTVTPLAEHLNIEMDTSITLIDDPHWTEQPCKDAAAHAMAALKKGPVLIAWWSYIKYLCKDLGHKCPGGVTDFVGNDQVLVVTVEKGKVTSMRMDNENFVDPGPSPTPSPRPTPSPSPSPSPMPASATLAAGASLAPGDHLVSAGGVRLAMQSSDGNLVLYDAAGKNQWASDTTGHPGAHLTLQGSDGNLVLYSSEKEALWSSKPHTGAAQAVLYDDCRFEVSDEAGSVLWSLGTHCSSESAQALSV